MNKRSEGRRNYNRKVNGKGGSKQEEDKPCPDFVFFFSSLLAGASCITVWSMGRVSTGWCLFLKSDECTEKSTTLEATPFSFSFFRFKHHCMSYRGPTVTLMRLGRDVVLAVAVDVEWR